MEEELYSKHQSHIRYSFEEMDDSIIVSHNFEVGRESAFQETANYWYGSTVSTDGSSQIPVQEKGFEHLSNMQGTASRQSALHAIPSTSKASTYSSTHPSTSSSSKSPKYFVTVYYSVQFEALREKVLSPEKASRNGGKVSGGATHLDYISALCRCAKWNSRGGKSNAYFAKSGDDRFVIKQLNKSELQSFLDFAPEYFHYVGKSIDDDKTTCLTKILGLYQVVVKFKGKETRMDLYVMENLFYNRQVETIYDLKGSMRSRYISNTDMNTKSPNKNVVLMDENLVERLSSDPLLLEWKAREKLIEAIHNDTNFLSHLNVMDYSLLVGIDAGNQELVVGIIDFLRQYTWDKQLETWAKSSGIVGGTNKGSPTVTSPLYYMERFRTQMSTYFRIMPDRWTPESLCKQYGDKDVLKRPKD